MARWQWKRNEEGKLVNNDLNERTNNRVNEPRESVNTEWESKIAKEREKERKGERGRAERQWTREDEQDEEKEEKVKEKGRSMRIGKRTCILWNGWSLFGIGLSGLEKCQICAVNFFLEFLFWFVYDNIVGTWVISIIFLLFW